MTALSPSALVPPPEVEPVILSVASTLLSAQGLGTPSDTEFPLEWDLSNEDSQIRIMHDVVLDVFKSAVKLESTFGPSLFDDVLVVARRLLQQEKEQELADANAHIQAELRDSGQPYNRDAKGEEKFWDKEATS